LDLAVNNILRGIIPFIHVLCVYQKKSCVSTSVFPVELNITIYLAQWTLASSWEQ